MYRSGVIRIHYLITGLNTGGAELMLLRLIEGLDRRRFSPSVVSMTDLGAVSQRFRDLGVSCSSLEMKPGVLSMFELRSFVRTLRAARPDVLHTWMYHADLFGGIAAWQAGGIPSIWCVRNGTLDKTTKLQTRLVVRACALLSSVLPRRIVICSEAARQVHEQLGYDARAIRVIPNGFDIACFSPSAPVRARVRKALGIPADVPVVSHIARFDPQKDHISFIQCCKKILDAVPTAHILMCGQDITWDNEAIGGAVLAVGLPREQVHLLGRRADVADLLRAVDVSSSSSYGESFPNVLAEAMACGVPCAATDVGDSAYIVGNAGRIVPPRDPAALASAIVELLRMTRDERHALGLSARGRVEKMFNMPDIVARYEALYEEVMCEKRR